MTTPKFCCPHCGQFESRVINIRGVLEQRYVKRRRECLRCGCRFTTQERIVGTYSVPSKEPYNI